MPDGYTMKNLMDVEDRAPGSGLGEVQQARFAAKDLEAKQVGVAHQRIRPNTRQPFGHRHEQAEEVYVVLAGSGRVKLGDAIEEVKPLDALRVAANVTRAFEAGPDGLDLLAFGQHHEGDGEIIQGWWTD